MALFLSKIFRVRIIFFLALHLGSKREVMAINRHFIKDCAIGICAIDIAGISLLKVDVLPPKNATIFLETAIKIKELAIGRNHPDAFFLPLGCLAMARAVIYITSEDMNLMDLFNFRIIKHTGDILEDVQCYFRLNIEEFPVVTDAKVGEALDVAMNQFLRLHKLDRLQRRIYFERQRNGGVVQFL